MHKRQNVILIVDDTPENLRVLGELLESDGHEVRVATNGPHGLEIAAASGVDLILLDIMMPEMDGYEVCRRLKRDKKTKELPVIFLTALDSPEDEAKGLKLGAVDYITKPFKLELVRTRVANQLALHNARLELRRHNESLEELVAERSQELAAAHARLLTLDSAKYDFLQMIYQRLWAPGQGIIDLSREAISSLGNEPNQATLRQRYEESQAELFHTINNALLMAGTHTGDKSPRRHPVRLDVVLTDAFNKWTAEATQRSIRFDPPEGQPALAAGDLDLVFQVIATVVHATVHLAGPGSAITSAWTGSATTVGLELMVSGAADAGANLESLFHESTRFHPSDVGRALGLAVPLASKIIRTLDGTIEVVGQGEGVWTFRTTLPVYTKKAGVRIQL